MRFGIHTLDDFDLAGKTVICRVDMNQPVDRVTGKLKSSARIRACAPTVRELSDKGAKVVLLAHQGSDIEYKNFYTTAPHAQVLSEFVGRPVEFIDDVTGPAARERICSLKCGEILLLDNVRFCSEEQTLFETSLKLTHEQQAKTQVVTKLAPLADLYVCDAFAAAHRDQPSLCGFEEVLPSAMGRLFEQEYCTISELMENPSHPCTFLLGGAKVADAFLMMNTVLENGSADTILTGGLVGEIMLAARGEQIGSQTRAFIEKEGYWGLTDKAKQLLEQYGARIRLPIDLATAANGIRQEARVGQIPADFDAADIGTDTIEAYRAEILHSATVFMNGPVGIFEKPESEAGTRALLETMARTKAHTVIGGGDSVTAAAKFGVSDKINYICTGGGALIRFLTGEELPVVTALRNAAKRG